MSELHTIEHFRRLAPNVQHDLALRFGLVDNGDDRVGYATYLLRAKMRGKMDQLAEAVQLAPQ